VDSLAVLRDLPQSVADVAIEMFADAKGWTVGRVTEVLAMSSHRDVERSLQANVGDPHLRLPDEESYPKSGWLGEYLNYSQGNEVPMAYHFWTAITVLGAAAKRNYFLDMGVYRIYPNQYVLLLGPSGLKKSTALNIGQDLLTRVNRKLEERGAAGHELIKIMPNKMGPEVFLKEMKSMPLSGSKGMEWTDSVALILASELSVLIGKQVFHSEMFIELLTDLYDCPERWRSGTITRGNEEFHNIAVSMLGCSTPDWAMDSVSEKLFTGGFFGRLVLCWREFSNKAFPYPQFLDPVVAERLSDRLTDIANVRKVRVFQMTAEAKEWYEEFYYANHERMVLEQEEELRGYLSRKHNHVFSTAMALALSDGPEPILAANHLRLAEFYLQREEDLSLRKIVSTVGQHEDDKLANRLMMRLWKIGKGKSVTRTQLSRGAMHVVGNSDRMELMLRTLKQRGWLREEMESTEGRPVTRYVIVGWHPGMASGEEG